MTKDQVISVRNQIDSLTFQVPKEDGTLVTLKTPIHLFCNTNVAQYIDYRDGSFIWDDDRELCIVFSYNSNEMMNMTPAMSPGSKPVAPVYVGYLEYASIIAMRAILIEETLIKLMDTLNLSEDDRKAIYKKFFIDTDQRTIIARKNEIGYSNQGSKSVEKNRYYDERVEYLKTVHAQSL